MNSRIFKFSVPVRITIGSPCSRHFAHAGLLMIEQSSFGFVHPTSNARYSLVQFGSVAIQTCHGTGAGIAGPLPNNDKGLQGKNDSNDETRDL
jgi:hypothetical protein